MKATPLPTLVDAHAASLPQVLVMISDPILGVEYRKALKSKKYCLVWHEQSTGWESTLKNFKYDVVVLDLSLFPKDPIAPIWTIKSLAPETEILVLADTDEVTTAINAFRAGITDYFLKPASPEGLAWSIEKILRRKELSPLNSPLGEDLRVFSAVHQIHISENENKMREVAVRQITQVLGGKGSLWVWISGPPPAKLTFENHGSDEEAAKQRLHKLREQYQDCLELSFDKGLTTRPEKWVRNDVAWIPLKSVFLGGVFVYGLDHTPNEGDLGRLEFLVRNLEIALENLTRHKEVKQLTYVDDVTGLYNSRYLGIALGAAIAQYSRTKSPFSVLFIDIDKFKNVNDGNGHVVGSKLLTEIADILKSTLRKHDLLFRYGGDEFIVMLYDVPSERTFEIAERLRATVEKKKFFVLGKEFNITISIGVAHYPEHGKDRQTILQMADDAMYNSKKNGRNRVFIAASEKSESAPALPQATPKAA